MGKVKFDSEAMQDVKATSYQQRMFISMGLATVTNDYELYLSSFNNLMEMGKMFPNTTAKFPQSVWIMFSIRFGLYFSAKRREWEKVEAEFEKMFAKPNSWGGILPMFTNWCWMNYSIVQPAILVYQKRLEANEDVTLYKKFLISTINLLTKLG